MLSKSKNLELLNIEGVQVDLDSTLGSHRQLRELNAKSNNKITALPTTIGKCHKLESIELSGSSLRALTEQIGKCSSLEELYLNDCMICGNHYLPSITI